MERGIDMNREPFVAGEIYHVFNRGVDKRKIFQDAEDYQRFLNTVLSIKQDGTTRNFHLRPIGIELYAYCLNPNHFHFVIRSQTEKALSLFMQQLCTSYAMYFNLKNLRSGRLFEGHFKAKHVSKDAYLLWIMSYVTFNAQIHGISDAVEKYRWCSYRELFGLTPRRLLTDIKPLIDIASQNEFYKKLCFEHAKMMSETKIMKKWIFE